MKWYWQILLYVIGASSLVFATYIWQFIKYHFIWDFSKQMLQFKLNPIWNSAGIVEITGGAETGKTLLIVLLTQYLKGRKWSNVPNIIPGHQDLDLSVLKDHWTGEFKKGLVGVNNVLLIDESWEFFSAKNLENNHLTEEHLSSLMFFFSETSKTQFKIFYVKKLGFEAPAAFNILSANKTISIRTLGVRHYCKWWKKDYYYLDIHLVTPKAEINNPNLNKVPNSAKKDKYGIENKNNRLKKTEITWWKRWFGIGRNYSQIISIPFDESDLRVYDRTWNIDRNYERKRMISIVDELKADGLVEGMGYKRSRTQILQEENEILMWYKKHPDKGRQKEMAIRGLQIMKKRGLWKPAIERIEEEEKELKKKLDNGQISPVDYKEKSEALLDRKTKLYAKLGKHQTLSSEELKSAPENQGENPMEEVAINEKEEKNKKPE